MLTLRPSKPRPIEEVNELTKAIFLLFFGGNPALRPETKIIKSEPMGVTLAQYFLTLLAALMSSGPCGSAKSQRHASFWAGGRRLEAGV